MKRFSKFIQEAKLSQSQRDRLDDLILNVHMTTHPEYEGNEGPKKYLDMIRKEFGDNVAKQVNDGIEKVHWGRDNQSGGVDKLSWRKGNARITKSGKMNAQDVKALKNRIKRDKAWGLITKKVKLPEAIELDEKLKASDDMGDWVKDFQDSDAPQFKGKSQKKRQQMAIAAKLSAERNEEVELEEKAYVSSLSPDLGRKGSHDVIGKDGKVVKSYPYTKQGMNLAQKHLEKMKEEVELDEISRDLVRRYIRKVADKTNTGELSTKQVMKRKPGVTLAGKKAYPGVAGEPKVRATESVELDELSAVTLGKYSQKARTDALDHSGGPWGKKKDPARVEKRLKGDAMAGKKLDKMRSEEVELDEVSDKKLDAYRQKAFADQPAGDDGSDKYRKRKFGRDLAFAKQTGRAKVLATKESVELDEAKTDIYHKHMLKALGKTRLPKDHSFTSAIATNGDFVVKDGGGRTVGRIPKGEHNLKDK